MTEPRTGGDRVSAGRHSSAVDYRFYWLTSRDVTRSLPLPGSVVELYLLTLTDEYKMSV